MSENKPITREEMFLAKAGGQDVTPPTPITRTEQFLQAIIDNGGSGGGGTGGGALKVTDTDGVLDKTWQEIYDVVSNGAVVPILGIGNEGIFTLVMLTKVIYGVAFIEGTAYQLVARGFMPGDLDGSYEYVALTANDYPTLQED